MCCETGAGFCKDHPDEHFVGYGEPVDADACDDLRNAAPEELLEAVIWFVRQSDSAPCDLERALVASLRQGFQLARPGGWQHVAPMWLRESRKLRALDE